MNEATSARLWVPAEHRGRTDGLRFCCIPLPKDTLWKLCARIRGSESCTYECMVCVDSLRTCPNLQVSDQSLPPFLCLQGFPLVFREPPPFPLISSSSS